MKPISEAEVVGKWKRFTRWVILREPIVRLAGISLGLGVFLLFIPQWLRSALWYGIFAHKALASLLIIFSLLTLSLIWTTGQQLDTRAFRFFNIRGARPIWLDRFMVWFTQLGNGFAALGIALIIFAFGNQRLAYELILGILTLWLVVEIIKFLVHRSRPFKRVTETRIVGYQAIGRSFPSGHTSLAFFIATLLGMQFHFNVWIMILLYIIAGIVGITRMYVGAHYPRDVLAGAILGTAWGMIGMAVNGYIFSAMG